ncbi:MAG TPA: protein-disulfide reductase DsbD domain-containing protein [Chryseolinea sp.]|nr:protein-disulfide reductase DsbD domain-containing protein [Chryseolinea sp.]
MRKQRMYTRTLPAACRHPLMEWTKRGSRQEALPPQGRSADHLSALITFMLLTLCMTGQTQVAATQLVTYKLQHPDEAEKGKPFNINVLFTIEPEWYIYASTGTNAAQGMIETKVTFSLPPGITMAGRMEMPEALFKNGYEVLEGKDIAMRQSFYAAKAGSYEINGKVMWQTCSADVCLPPVMDEFTAMVRVK